MKAEYELSKMKARKNPYASKLKKPVTMRLSEDIIGYFKEMADKANVAWHSIGRLIFPGALSPDLAFLTLASLLKRQIMLLAQIPSE